MIIINFLAPHRHSGSLGGHSHLPEYRRNIRLTSPSSPEWKLTTHNLAPTLSASIAAGIPASIASISLLTSILIA